MALVPVDLPRVIEEANRACKAWHYLAGGWDGRPLAWNRDGSPAPHSDLQPKCIRMFFVPSKDDRQEIEGTLSRPGQPDHVYMRADTYRRAFKHYWGELDDARRRLVALLNGGDIAVLDCDVETRYDLRTMWLAIDVIPTAPPEFKLEGKQDFRISSDLSFVLGMEADHIQARLATSAKTESTPLAEEPVSSTPKTYLRSWPEILACLELPKEEKYRVVQLVDKFDGPIISTGQGGQPFAVKSKLLDWWNRLEQLVLESSQRMVDKEATAAERHNFGRDGTAAPGIGGGVKGRQPKENITKHQKT